LIDTYDFARDLVYRVATDLGGINFANEVIKPAKELQGSVISKRRSAGVVTLRTSSAHEAVPGQEIEVVEVGSGLDGLHVVSEVPDSTTVRYELSGADFAEAALSGIRSLNVTQKQLIDNVATITVDRPHGASVGQTVILDGVDAFFTGRLDTTFNGRFTVTGTPSATSFTFVSGGILNVGASAVAGGIATFGSKFIYGDYGSFTSNADIGILFENLNKSGSYQDTQIFRGFEQRSVGEILETYSNTVDGGFEYRVDCDYDLTLLSSLVLLKLFLLSVQNLLQVLSIQQKSLALTRLFSNTQAISPHLALKKVQRILQQGSLLLERLKTFLMLQVSHMQVLQQKTCLITRLEEAGPSLTKLRHLIRLKMS